VLRRACNESTGLIGAALHLIGKGNTTPFGIYLTDPEIEPETYPFRGRSRICKVVYCCLFTTSINTSFFHNTGSTVLYLLKVLLLICLILHSSRKNHLQIRETGAARSAASQIARHVQQLKQFCPYFRAFKKAD